MNLQLQPLRFIDRELFPYLVKVTKLMASHVNADPRDLVLVPNATSALNAVIQVSNASLCPSWPGSVCICP